MHKKLSYYSYTDKKKRIEQELRDLRNKIVCVFENRNNDKTQKEIVKICKLKNIQAAVRLISANKSNKEFTSLSRK